MADAGDSKSPEACPRVGSTPTSGTNPRQRFAAPPPARSAAGARSGPTPGESRSRVSAARGVHLADSRKGRRSRATLRGSPPQAAVCRPIAVSFLGRKPPTRTLLTNWQGSPCPGCAAPLRYREELPDAPAGFALVLLVCAEGHCWQERLNLESQHSGVFVERREDLEAGAVDADRDPRCTGTS